MNLDELPTNGEWDSWQYVLAGGDEYTEYSGAFSTQDRSKVDDVTAERIARVDLWFGESPEGYGSQDFVALVELADGQWATCMAWADTTGWDCSSDVQWKVAPSRAEAIEMGLDRESRAKLGVPLAHEAEPPPSPLESPDSGYSPSG